MIVTFTILVREVPVTTPHCFAGTVQSATGTAVRTGASPTVNVFDIVLQVSDRYLLSQLSFSQNNIIHDTGGTLGYCAHFGTGIYNSKMQGTYWRSSHYSTYNPKDNVMYNCPSSDATGVTSSPYCTIEYLLSLAHRRVNSMG